MGKLLRLVITVFRSTQTIATNQPSFVNMEDSDRGSTYDTITESNLLANSVSKI